MYENISTVRLTSPAAMVRGNCGRNENSISLKSIDSNILTNIFFYKNNFKTSNLTVRKKHGINTGQNVPRITFVGTTGYYVVLRDNPA